MPVYGQAISGLAPDRARQLTENGCTATVLHGGAEIGTLPIDYGVHGARRGCANAQYNDSGIQDALLVCCISGHIYQHLNTKKRQVTEHLTFYLYKVLLAASSCVHSLSDYILSRTPKT